jgi:hypothetical protein
MWFTAEIPCGKPQKTHVENHIFFSFLLQNFVMKINQAMNNEINLIKSVQIFVSVIYISKFET